MEGPHERRIKTVGSRQFRADRSLVKVTPTTSAQTIRHYDPARSEDVARGVLTEGIEGGGRA